jgi:hypothetical protein
MVEKRKRGRPNKKDQELVAMQAKLAMQAKGTYKDSIAVRKAKAKDQAQKELNQRHEGAVNLRYVAERLRDIKNMDEVEAFYKECVYNIGINTLRNGEADG